MIHRFSRTELVVGPEGLERLKNAHVAVLGVGGVGSYAVEALARSGVGTITLVDRDTVDITNINRQIPALTSTIGREKVEVMRERILDINPACQVHTMHMFFLPETAERFFSTGYDYVIDAMDTVSAKIDLVCRCKERDIPLVTSMGAANKIDPTRFTVMDLFETQTDPIARVMRRELRKRGISRNVPVVCSTEPPRLPREDVRRAIVPDALPADATRKASNPPASIAYVPPIAGLILASVAIRALAQLA
ncbi:tRNA threonylcarbamoyladenosine dehydratase [Ferroacidibacillus organovorans]|uniref:tRNA threonylcarbamoyladenosine dehydratase n=1 Tax=Ferroacidibacillus organovorans TaxID=1765683 RepID=A0A162TJX7_9BACL|nr:tRNA threonylcarbamoyladenosine dehydratase [Ferroacidibacillus organovorans]KYP80881.1 tRNA threonylcarbamoyladenosine dehydratase [Ferroacidibacillus organovorans]OAG95426.1 hypothetical protein AYW79_00510 [Ferroacidibacillus organovorans]OPG17569.1 tRNA threonylcarbamoyladenosine dehydratase [Ferroacidibacillus organovorans]